MKSLDMPPSLLYLIAVIAHASSPVSAAVVPPLDQNLPSLEDQQLVARGDCANPCGYYGQYCCEADESCYTNAANLALCGQTTAAPAVETVTVYPSGVWSMVTTTYVQTDLQTITTTYSTWIPGATGPAVTYALSQIPCGNTVCLAGQWCSAPNVCMAISGGSTAYYGSFTAGVPLRATTGTVLTVTSTGSPTATVPYETPIGTSGGLIYGAQATTQGHVLSGGAIAGIVIGVIAGIILLLLLCACLCFKTLWDGLLSIFGINRRRRTETTEVYEERRHRRGRTWFGAPAKASRTSVDVVEKEKRGRGWGGLIGVGAALSGLALLLGWKRQRDRRREEDKSSASYGSYYSSEYTSESELFLTTQT